MRDDAGATSLSDSQFLLAHRLEEFECDRHLQCGLLREVDRRADSCEPGWFVWSATRPNDVNIKCVLAKRAIARKATGFSPNMPGLNDFGGLQRVFPNIPGLNDFG
jgi:hypothetical protein